MTKKSRNRVVHLIAAVVFAIVAILHTWRLLYVPHIFFGSQAVPLWLSLLGVIAAGTLAVLLLKSTKN